MKELIMLIMWLPYVITILYMTITNMDADEEIQ